MSVQYLLSFSPSKIIKHINLLQGENVSSWVLALEFTCMIFSVATSFIQYPCRLENCFGEQISIQKGPFPKGSWLNNAVPWKVIKTLIK